jgi:hypothetical protein
VAYRMRRSSQPDSSPDDGPRRRPPPTPSGTDTPTPTSSCELRARCIPAAGTPVVPHPIERSSTTISPWTASDANRVAQIGCAVGKWRVSKVVCGKGASENGVMRMTACSMEVRHSADGRGETQGRSRPGSCAPAFRFSPRTTPLRRSDDSDFHRSCAGSSSGEGSPLGRARTSGGFARRANLNDHDTARSSCEPIRRLDAVKLRWSRSGRRDIGLASPCRTALWRHGTAKVTRLRWIHGPTTTTRERPRAIDGRSPTCLVSTDGDAREVGH